MAEDTRGIGDCGLLISGAVFCAGRFLENRESGEKRKVNGEKRLAVGSGQKVVSWCMEVPGS